MHGSLCYFTQYASFKQAEKQNHKVAAQLAASTMEAEDLGQLNEQLQCIIALKVRPC